jgi:hypothetical protein
MNSLQGSQKQAELEKQVLKASLKKQEPKKQEAECAPPSEKYQSRLITKISSVAERVEEGTQTLRYNGLKLIADALKTLSDRVNRLNRNLDLEAPIEEELRASSQERVLRARKIKAASLKSGAQASNPKKSPLLTRTSPANRSASQPVAPESEQSPQGPLESGAV